MTNTNPPPALFAFACRVNWAPQWGSTTYNRATAGQAKADHFRHVREAWQDTKFTDIRVIKVGRPQSSADFVRCATKRGMPDAFCGQQVRVGADIGFIVGHNSSANFDVLFTTGKYSGQTLNVHPSSIET
jgi:hypothetical protein